MKSIPKIPNDNLDYAQLLALGGAAYARAQKDRKHAESLEQQSEVLTKLLHAHLARGCDYSVRLILGHAEKLKAMIAEVVE